MQLVDALVLTLKEWEVGRVFGVSGANIEHLHDSINRLGGDELVSVMAKTEVGAAFMADARARTGRTLGVCCATSGGGMMNLAVGIAESFSESVPVLAIVGQVPTALEGRGGFQDSSGIGRTVDALGMWRTLTKVAVRLDDPSVFWETLKRAAMATMHGRPGPSVLLIPRDMYEREVPPRPACFPRTLEEIRPRVSPPCRRQTRRLFDAIVRAEHPVLVLGTGVERSVRHAAVVEFAERCGAAVATTMANPSTFPNAHPRYLGTVGVAGHPSAHRYINEVADLVVLVGCGLNVMVGGPLAPCLGRARLAAVNVDVEAIERISAIEIAVHGDAGAAFVELGAMQGSDSPPRRPPLNHRRTRYRPRLADPKSTPPSSTGTLLQSDALEILQSYLPEEGHVFFDAGNCAAAAVHYLDIPDRVSGTIALGMGGMGYAIAGAIGAPLDEARGQRSMVLCGDGAFLMHGLEVHTAVELGLPILFVVFNNSKHGMCVTRQQAFFEGRIECSAYAPVGIAAVARGFGTAERLWVGRASTRPQLVRQLDAYVQRAAGPGVVELVLPHEQVPPFAPLLGEGATEQAVDMRPLARRRPIRSVA